MTNPTDNLRTDGARLWDMPHGHGEDRSRHSAAATIARR
jgi:hypothetical protein